jgi:phosphatidylserine decarboxylase
LGIVAALISLPLSELAFVGFLGLTIFLMFVFRDPSREPGEGIVAPADGVVREIDTEKGLVSIYLALANVHVTRSPIAGTVTKMTRIPGKHYPAFSRRSPNNERVELIMDTSIGSVTVIQMSGILARRIVPYVDSGHVLEKAERLSLIRFGSRVDILFPSEKIVIKAKLGQRLRAGVTCVAEAVDERVE